MSGVSETMIIRRSVQIERLEDTEISPEDLKLINKLALKPIAPERLYVLPYIASSTDLDAHSTWFKKAALDMLSAEGNEGMQPLQENHAKTQHNIGRVFWSRVERGEDRPDEIVSARKVGARSILRRRAYMTRDVSVAGTSNEQRIQMIEDGTQRDVSIAALAKRMTCDICGGNYLSRWDDAEGCQHFQGLAYSQDGKDGEKVICTVGVDAARGVEDSLVFRGSNSVAVIGRAVEDDMPAVVERGRWLFRNGLIAPVDAERIEDEMGFLVRERQSVPAPALPEKATPQETEMKLTDAMKSLVGEDRMGRMSVYRAATDGDDAEGLALVRMLVAEADDAKRKAEADLKLAGQEKAEIARLLGADEKEPLADAARRVVDAAKMGLEARTQQLKRYVEAHRTVYGDAETNEERLTTLTRGWTLDDLTTETAKLDKQRDNLVGGTGGRKSGSAPAGTAEVARRVLSGAAAAAMQGG